VAGRALVFSNPQVVQMAKSSFVPYAGDQWYLHRQKDTAGQLFWKIAQQGHSRSLPEDATRQGIYVAAPDGQLLGSDHFHPSAERMVALLRKSLDRWNDGPKAASTVAAEAVDPQYRREPPEGGLILKVYTRIPLEPEPAEKWSANQAVGRDHMWLTSAEWRSLLPAKWEKGARYPVPPAVAERLVRFHLLDNVRGEPPTWDRAAVRRQELALEVDDPETGRLHLSGLARLQSGDGGPRGYDARLQGVLLYDEKISRFRRVDILSWGEAWGEGRYTRGAPPGKFPLVVALSLGAGLPADRIPPQACRSLGEYLGTGR
jgi:hypothetical protein